MRGPGTLRNRLALVALVATAGWVVALTVLFNLLLGAQLRGQADDLLQTRATAARATVKVAADGRLTVREPRNDAGTTFDTGSWTQPSISVECSRRIASRITSLPAMPVL